MWIEEINIKEKEIEKCIYKIVTNMKYELKEIERNKKYKKEKNKIKKHFNDEIKLFKRQSRTNLFEAIKEYKKKEREIIDELNSKKTIKICNLVIDFKKRHEEKIKLKRKNKEIERKNKEKEAIKDLKNRLYKYKKEKK